MTTEGSVSYVGGSPEQVLSHDGLPGNRQALPTFMTFLASFGLAREHYLSWSRRRVR